MKLTKERFKIKFNSMSYLDGEFLGDVIADNDDTYRYRYMSLLINQQDEPMPPIVGIQSAISSEQTHNQYKYNL